MQESLRPHCSLTLQPSLLLGAGEFTLSESFGTAHLWWARIRADFRNRQYILSPAQYSKGQGLNSGGRKKLTGGAGMCNNQTLTLEFTFHNKSLGVDRPSVITGSFQG